MDFTDDDVTSLIETWDEQKQEMDEDFLGELPKEICCLSFGYCTVGIDENGEGFVRIENGGTSLAMSEEEILADAEED